MGLGFRVPEEKERPRGGEIAKPAITRAQLSEFFSVQRTKKTIFYRGQPWIEMTEDGKTNPTQPTNQPRQQLQRQVRETQLHPEGFKTNQK